MGGVLRAAIGREEIADYVSALLFVYLIMIFARVLVSWIPRMPYDRRLAAVIRFLYETTDPYLNVFRRVLPPIGGRVGIDLSPMLAIFVLLIVQGIVVGLIRG